MVRIPNFVSYVSITDPPTESVVTAMYRFGFWLGGGPQSFGLEMVVDPLTDCFAPLPTLVVDFANVATTDVPTTPLLSISYTLVLTSTCRVPLVRFSTWTTKLTVAELEDTVGVVMYVPYCAT